MSYYKTWMDKSEDASNRQEYIEYINRYYALEKVAYEKVLGSYPDTSEVRILPLPLVFFYAEVAHPVERQPSKL